MKNFSLVPFAFNNAPKIAIAGQIQRQQNQLEITYQVSGGSLAIVPEPAVTPTRQYELWEHTCCELFLKPQNGTQYWEFNLSPARHWNVFRFPDYRQDIAEEMAFDSLPFAVERDEDVLQVYLKVDLNKIIAPEQNLKIGVTTVVEDRDKRLSYWALTHPASQPDFHHRDSFTINL